ncbi:9477_t:CDS:2 [Entrophospora sp. SA101]|nr:9472_t:CDS:2 [Entrophospora sp. SA101]CAJ0835079.1 9477_t:CDS:2 [Entrophospora sp. SA101]
MFYLNAVKIAVEVKYAEVKTLEIENGEEVDNDHVVYSLKVGDTFEIGNKFKCFVQLCFEQRVESKALLNE